VSLVVTCDLRSSFGAIRNQGNRPTCVAFAVSDAHAAARGARTALSVEHLYYHAVQRTPGGRPQDGVSLARILDALRLDGQAAESRWPYLPAVPDDLALWVPPPTATPVFKADSVTALPAAAAIVAELNAGRPVVLTFMVSLAFCAVQDGIVRPKAADTDVDWHAVVAVGHGQNEGRPCLLVRNSWGEAWGLGGYAWVDLDYLLPRLNGFATINSVGSA